MKRYFPFIVLIIFLVFIFGLSSQNIVTSKGISSDIALVIYKILYEVEHKVYNYDKIHYLVRKLAHLIQYLMLSVVIVSGFNNLFRRIIPSLIISAFICISIAYFDEVLQSTLVDRTSSFLDVIIDTIGALSGITVIGTFSFFRWIEAPKK